MIWIIYWVFKVPSFRDWFSFHDSNIEYCAVFWNMFMKHCLVFNIAMHALYSKAETGVITLLALFPNAELDSCSPGVTNFVPFLLILTGRCSRDSSAHPMKHSNSKVKWYWILKCARRCRRLVERETEREESGIT